jgi:hypothetical protein
MTRDITGTMWLHDVWIAGRCLRLVWRGFSCPQRPYGWFRWGVYSFGAGPIGFMFWPKRREA